MCNLHKTQAATRYGGNMCQHKSIGETDAVIQSGKLPVFAPYTQPTPSEPQAVMPRPDQRQPVQPRPGCGTCSNHCQNKFRTLRELVGSLMVTYKRGVQNHKPLSNS